MRPSFDSQPPTGKPRSLWALIIVIVVICFGIGAFVTQRVTAFSDSVFAGSQRPPELDGLADLAPDEEPTPQPTETPVVVALTQPAAMATATMTQPTATLVPSATPVDPASLVGKLRAGKAVSVLLIGYGGPGHDGPYLTDALVVAHVDPVTSQLTMFNLPRDLWVQPVGANGRPAGYFRRINEVYGVGLGPAAFDGRPASPQDHDRAAWSTAAVAQAVLGLPVDGWVSADFDAVRRVVDGLGGVTVNVETAFDDYEYPRNDNPAIDGGTMHVSFRAGSQRLTGEQALQYARSRHAAQDGSDFGRSRRQQRLLVGLKDEVMRPETLPKVFALMDALQGHLRTSLVTRRGARSLAVRTRT